VDVLLLIDIGTDGLPDMALIGLPLASRPMLPPLTLLRGKAKLLSLG
jgi:hypothetical protein